MNNDKKIIHLGNVYGIKSHGGCGGDIFSTDGICRTLASVVGGSTDMAFNQRG